MSQVIVTDDEYKSEREKTKAQEQRIPRDQEFEKWRLGDISNHPKYLRMILGPVIAPVMLFWSVLMIGVGYAIAIVAWIMRICAMVFGGNRTT